MSGSNRYKEFESLMTAALLAATAIFFLYLIIASVGIVWLKWVLAIIELAICVGGFAVLWLSRELRRQRSIWMGCGFFGLAACLLVSLILNYPG